MNIKYYAEIYKKSLKADKTAATIEGYSRTLDLYMKDYYELTTANLMAWRTEQSERVGITSLNLYCQHLMYFCRFIKAMDKDFEMPDFSIIMPDKRKVSKAKRKPYEHVMTCEQVVEILNSYKPKRCHNDTWPRNKAILTVFLTASCRNKELCAIRPCDLDYENGRVFLVDTKGGEERYAAFPKTAQKAVEDYLQSGYRPATLTDEDPVFVTVQEDGAWSKFDRVVMSSLVERLVQKITGMPDIRSHALRHASASFMLTNNVPIDVVQQALGHANISNTVIYAKRLTNTQQNVGSIFDSALAAGV
jgi:integrase/recombinase XerD